MRRYLIVLMSLAILVPGAVADEDVNELDDHEPDYCIVIAPSQMPPVVVEPDNCKIPPEWPIVGFENDEDDG